MVGHPSVNQGFSLCKQAFEPMDDPGMSDGLAMGGAYETENEDLYI
jgi:hypothetical protein